MSPYSQSILWVAFAALLSYSSADTQLIMHACKIVNQSARDPSIQYYKECVKFLLSDPRSKTANLEGLGEIAFQLTQKRTVVIQSQIKELQKSSKFDAPAQSCLARCAELYSEAESSLGDGLTALKKKDYSSANIHASAALDSAINCEEGFNDVKRTSPLTQLNNHMFRFGQIPLVFTTMFGGF